MAKRNLKLLSRLDRQKSESGNNDSKPKDNVKSK